ncbi:MAG: YceI family protein [Acidimicrobiia bacterium]|nr:YceI family protein [Acidimicrobiia bacterium]
MDTIDSTETVAQTRRRWSGRRWATTIVIVVIVLAIAVPYIYIHFIEGSAPKKFSLTSVGSSGGAPVALDGAWHVTKGSQAGYRVDETLLGQHNTAVGRTDNVSGTMDVGGSTVKSATFVVDMATVKSDQRLRDRTYAGRIMDTSSFPTSTFTLTKSIDFGKPPASGTAISTDATGKLTLKGVTRAVTAHLKAEHNGGTIEVVGQIPVKFADWNISAPVFPGVAQGQDHGTVEFMLFFTHGPGNPTPTTEATTPTTAFQPGGGGGRPPGGGGGFNQPTITTSPTTVPPLELK